MVSKEPEAEVQEITSFGGGGGGHRSFLSLGPLVQVLIIPYN